MITSSNGTSNRRVIKLRGTVTSGLGESRFFTEIPWVRKQFVDKLGINAYPGTFNIIILAEDQERLSALREAKGIEITPEDISFCAAHSFPVLVSGKIRGAVIIPLVPNYPPAQLEIISPENIKQALSLKDGDIVEVEVYI